MSGGDRRGVATLLKFKRRSHARYESCTSKIKSKSQRAAVQWCMADDGPWRKFAGHLQGGYKRLSFSFQQEWGLLWLRRLWTVHINIYLIEAQHFIPNCRMYSIDYTERF